MATGTIQKNMVLLWENPRPSSPFDSQTISLDLSNYSFIVLLAVLVTTKPEDMFTALLTKGVKNAVTAYNGDGSKSGRDFTPSDSGIVCGTGTDPGSSFNNARMIPYQIFGIKA
jgi:hypothetical protein